VPSNMSMFKDFLNDVTPFFRNKFITYFDAGAHTGGTLKEVSASSLRMNEAILFEPNPANFDLLVQNVKDPKIQKIICRNLALADRQRVVSMRSADTMTKVVSEPGAEDDDLFNIDATTIDDAIRETASQHIHLLKMDVEGYEIKVLKGAKKSLEKARIDVIYVEAGLDIKNKQQVYYRDIEDNLNSFGYKIFKIYEQKHEWIEDSPFLRRVNIAFFSPGFAERSPFKLTQELYALHKRCREFEAQLKPSGQSGGPAEMVREVGEASALAIHSAAEERGGKPREGSSIPALSNMIESYSEDLRRIETSFSDKLSKIDSRLTRDSYLDVKLDEVTEQIQALISDRVSAVCTGLEQLAVRTDEMANNIQPSIAEVEASVARALADQRTLTSSLQEALASLEGKAGEVEWERQERAREVGILQKRVSEDAARLEQLSSDVERAQSSADALSQENELLRAANERLMKEVAILVSLLEDISITSDITWSTDMSISLVEKVDDLRSKLAQVASRNQHDISVLQKDLIAARRQLEDEHKSAQDRQRAASVAIHALLEAASSRLLPKFIRLKKKVNILRKSGLLEAEWYLQYNPDVSKAGKDPFEHYAAYGAAEGRRPNSKF
jgi:FkbM family methyltransferase